MLPFRTYRTNMARLTKMIQKRRGEWKYVDEIKLNSFKKPAQRVSPNFLSNKLKRYFSSSPDYRSEYETKEQVHYNLSNPEELRGDETIRTIVYQKKSQKFDVKILEEMLEVEEDEMNLALKYVGKSRKDKMSLEDARIIGSIFNAQFISEREDLLAKEKRPPIITIMGHVDHGKTTLLDAYRDSRITDGEYGGITQKVGGFMVSTEFGPVTFIDTPGHALFTNMRRRGAQCTDMAILVVSAVEGVQSQTHEVLKILQEEKIPFVIAINKVDAAKADPERVENQLIDLGVQIEPAGGNIAVVHISALERMNIDLLLELLIFEAENYGIVASPKHLAVAIALESKQKTNKLCSLIIRDGTLKIGNILVGEKSYCKVRGILDDLGNPMKEAGPSSAIEVEGFDNLPAGGEILTVVETEKIAKKIIEAREFFASMNQVKSSDHDSSKGGKIKFRNRRERMKFYSGKKENVKDKYDTMVQELEELIELKKLKGDDDISELEIELEKNKEILAKMQEVNYKKNLIFKASEYGTIETLLQLFETIRDSDGNSNLNLIKAEVGPISEHDLEMAQEFSAEIICMDLPAIKDKEMIEKERKIKIHHYNIIYKLQEYLIHKNDENTFSKFGVVNVGTAIVEQLFHITVNQSLTRAVLGSRVASGQIDREQCFRILRNGNLLADELKVSSMRHFDSDVTIVRKGTEFGISFEEDLKVEKGDVIECYKKRLG